MQTVKNTIKTQFNAIVYFIKNKSYILWSTDFSFQMLNFRKTGRQAKIFKNKLTKNVNSQTNKMNDFSRFEQIFGIDSSNKKQKSPATPVPKSRKRKSLPQLIRSPALPNRKFRVETPTQKNQKPVIVSPDKREILLHLSCNEEDFQNVSVSDSDDSDGFEK